MFLAYRCDKPLIKVQDLRHRPFECMTCHKSFGRQDVLSRHQRLHETLPSSEGAGSQPIPSPRAAVNSGSANVADEQVLSPDINIGISPSQDNSLSLNTPLTHAHLSQENSLGSSQLWPGTDISGSILPSFSMSWPVSLPGVQFHQPFPNLSLPEEVPIFQELPQTDVGLGHQAMDHMNRLISDLSTSLAAEIRGQGITSAFLDTCIHVFFHRFILTFPFLHEATFSIRESSYPLLLNIVALGSLFVGAKDAILKGETLWRLAHTAIATNWAKLMETKGRKDRCKGVQLVLTALTGQTYAILSKNKSFRSTAQTFHSLGFFWARQCGFYDDQDESRSFPPFGAGENENADAWTSWVAREVQNRAILGHYILDGYISQYSGNASSARHVNNVLRLPGSDQCFAATSADEWRREMEKSSFPRPSFREIYVMLFCPKTSMSSISIPNFAMRVILEGLQALVSDIHEANGPAVGTPSRSQVSQALIRLYTERLSLAEVPSTENMELLIRWHSICLDLAVPSTKLCRNLCSVYGIEQQLYDGVYQAGQELNLADWSQSLDARRALLHAMAIHDIVETLPLGRPPAIHLPAAIFTVGTIYSAHSLAACSSVVYPSIFKWEDVWSMETAGPADDERSDTTGAEIVSFLQGDYSGEAPRSRLRNLIFDANSLQITLGSISRWGVSHEMESVIQQWVSTIIQGQ
ncbi:C2H2 type zinc finger domain protein [Amylocarpus encephaloides]|uniref:C2H2 type zinc finger domain protein n=1 Tax=Amylocarpus encephaloides TaxID=45428 RepID=A0A9P7YKH2_9HELO|nr:C2H2 type zinc finger domain protein [Amylocarpus encephaloides]